ncbi:Phosphate-specific transport system accessory protein PhoU [Nymphon striatum]|nr:Phosphate-specific transport system accessory protein PhoU [Nymphon striatum]
MENEHIVKSFDEELSQIENMTLEMGGLVETQIQESVTALCDRDQELAQKVRLDDKTVDLLESEINDLTLRTLALRQPLATDLRSVICALKVSSNLERIGDYAKNISKRTQVLADVSSVGTAERTIKRMGEMVQKMVADVLNAYIRKDLAMADEIRLRDEEVDYIHNTLFRELLTYMMENPSNITFCMHLLFIARNLERMGDHATGIAEQVHYVVTGSVPEENRPKADKTSQMIVEENSEAEA